MKKAMLIIHGFVGSTYDNEYLANYLELDDRFKVFTNTLPGHYLFANYQIGKYEEWVNFTKKSIQELIDYGYKEALINTQNYFILRDNYGVLEQISLLSLKTNLLFSDNQNISKYNYTKSIDKDSYNRVKLVQDNTKEAVRKVYVVQDNENQRNWGILQYYEKVDKNATEQQIKDFLKLEKDIICNNIKKYNNGWREEEDFREESAK